jgi:hypothetical protein
VDSVDLVEFVFTREKGFFGDQLEENAAISPDVHFLIVVTVGHETLWSPVPPGGDIVGEGRSAMPAYYKRELLSLA